MTNTNTLPALTYDTPVRSAHWSRDITARVFTVTGYALKCGRNPVDALARAVEHRHDLVGTILPPSILLGDRAAAARKAAERKALAARAVTLATGDHVLIDGIEHTVRFSPRNETVEFPGNCDPIHFDRVA